MTKEQLLALADRCEREEPNSILNIHIARALGWKSVILGYVVWRNPAGRDASLPKFVDSLDAAVTLVPENWRWVLWCHINVAKACVHQTEPPGEMDDEATGVSPAKSPALALCAAALRARAAMETP